MHTDIDTALSSDVNLISYFPFVFRELKFFPEKKKILSHFIRTSNLLDYNRHLENETIQEYQMLELLVLR